MCFPKVGVGYKCRNFCQFYDESHPRLRWERLLFGVLIKRSWIITANAENNKEMINLKKVTSCGPLYVVYGYHMYVTDTPKRQRYNDMQPQKLDA